MDYINYVKQSPMMGQIGLGGGATSLGRWTSAAPSGPRALWGGGNTNSGNTNVIQYVTIASTGNASDFGNLTVGSRLMGGVDNDTRACYAGGESASNTYRNIIDYVTIASTGNATDFGDLLNSDSGGLSGAADSDHGVSGIDRGVYGGGYTSGGSPWQNTIQYITISSTGNATDFGDLVNNLWISACVGGL